LALCRNEELRTRLAQGAIQRSCAYSWQAKMKNLDEVYQKAAASHRLIAEDELHPESRFKAANESSDLDRDVVPITQSAQGKR
jgi:hypothetical protein